MTSVIRGTDDFDTAGKGTVVSGSLTSASGQFIDFLIPSWAKQITVVGALLSTTGTSQMQIQLGSGSIDTTPDWQGAVMREANFTTYSGLTGGRLEYNVTSAGDSRSFTAILTLLGNNRWNIVGNLGNNTQGTVSSFSGSKPLNGSLDRVRLTTANGTDTFDVGTVNVIYN
jgi:hypothetical protein